MLVKEEVTKILSAQKLKNANFIYFLENNFFVNAHKIGNSIFARAQSDHIWLYFSIDKEEDFPRLLAFLKQEDKYFATLEEWMLPYLQEKGEVDWQLKTFQYYLPDDVNLPIPCAEFRDLQISDAEYIYNNSDYKNFLSIDYIQERIEKGISSGMIINDNLAAWAITQDDGAIGFLHVLDEHRRNGYAYQIMLDMIHKVRIAGKIPLTYVEENNLKSVSLMEKIGFLEDKQMIWLKLK